MQAQGDFFQRDRAWHPQAYAPNYKTSALRAPRCPLVPVPHTLSELTGPVFGHGDLDPLDSDLLTNDAVDGSPIGERIIVHGRVLDETGRPVPHTLVEFWQANAAGRYRHKKDGYLAPLDPNFGGCGRAITGDDGSYHFRTVKPGAYPWPNFGSDWRPAHIPLLAVRHRLRPAPDHPDVFRGRSPDRALPDRQHDPEPGGGENPGGTPGPPCRRPLRLPGLQVRHSCCAAAGRPCSRTSPRGTEPWSQLLPYLKETPSQTAGPYVHIGLAPSVAGIESRRTEPGNVIAGPSVPGERIRIEGTVFDGVGAPVRDALLEIWQADHQGRHASPVDPRGGEAADGFRGCGRAACDFATGLYAFETVKPGPVPARNGGLMAPHVSLWVVARGINIGLHTRMYFSDEEAANAADPVLNRVEQAVRRETLIGRREAQDGRVIYRFNIRLQGDGETVFFDV